METTLFKEEQLGKRVTLEQPVPYSFTSVVHKNGHRSRKLSLSQDSYINKFQIVMSPYYKKLLHDLGS